MLTRAFKAAIIAIFVTAAVGVIVLGMWLLQALLEHFGLGELAAKCIAWVTAMFVGLGAYFYTQVDDE